MHGLTRADPRIFAPYDSGGLCAQIRPIAEPLRTRAPIPEADTPCKLWSAALRPQRLKPGGLRGSRRRGGGGGGAAKGAVDGPGLRAGARRGEMKGGLGGRGCAG